MSVNDVIPPCKVGDTPIIRTTLSTNLSLLEHGDIHIIKPISKDQIIEEVTVEDEATGVVTYHAIEGDLNEAGIYRSFIKLFYSDGQIFSSKTKTFEIKSEYM